MQAVTVASIFIRKSALVLSMITTDGNALMAPIHARMPVMIGDENLAKWLGEDAAPPDELRAMLKPFAPERMNAWPVQKAVGNVKSQGAQLVEPCV